MSASIQLLSPVAKTSTKLEAFEGIRGIASLSVFIGHLILAFWPAIYFPLQGWTHKYPSWVRWVAESPLRVLYDSQFGVSLFFILSGFVLSLSYFRNPSSEILASASVRRYARLMIPAFFSVLIAYLLMSAGWMYNSTAGGLMDSHPLPKAWVSSFYTQPPVARVALRQVLWDSFFVSGGNHYNANLWTMSVELPGSFMVYAFVAMFGTIRKRIVFYLAGAAVLMLSSKMFMLDFLVGTMIADLYASNERGNWRLRIPGLIAVGLALGAMYVVFKKPPAGTAPQYDLWGVATLPKAMIYEAIAGVVLIAATAFSPTLQRFFERRLFTFLGKISFSLYLVHLIVICSIACFIYAALRQQYGLGHNLASALAGLACITASVAVAWVMYILVDRPTIRITKWVYDHVFKSQTTPLVKRDQKVLPAEAPRAA